jgi:hypothetical protein
MLPGLAFVIWNTSFKFHIHPGKRMHPVNCKLVYILSMLILPWQGISLTIGIENCEFHKTVQYRCQLCKGNI